MGWTHSGHPREFAAVDGRAAAKRPGPASTFPAGSCSGGGWSGPAAQAAFCIHSLLKRAHRCPAPSPRSSASSSPIPAGSTPRSSSSGCRRLTAARWSPSPPTSARARSWSRRAPRRELLGIKPENIFIEDLREEFVRDYVFPMFRANALYEGQYLLGTSIARPLIAKRQIEIAREGRRRRRRPRRDRQGQRSGALRAVGLRAQARHQGHRAVARMGLRLARRR